MTLCSLSVSVAIVCSLSACLYHFLQNITFEGFDVAVLEVEVNVDDEKGIRGGWVYCVCILLVLCKEGDVLTYTSQEPAYTT